MKNDDMLAFLGRRLARRETHDQHDNTETDTEMEMANWRGEGGEKQWSQIMSELRRATQIGKWFGS